MVDSVVHVEGQRYETGHGPGRVLRTAGGDGLPVVFIHGFASSADEWRPLWPYLAAGRPIFAIDLLGFADAPAPPLNYSPRIWAEQVLRLLDAFALPRAVLVGHSLGGLVAMTTAQIAPERVAGLGLLNSLGVPTPHVERALGGVAGSMIQALRAEGTGERLFRLLRGNRLLAMPFAVGAFHDPRRASADALATWLDLIQRPDAEYAYLSVLRNLERMVVDPALGPISAPAAIVWGRQDRGLPAVTAERLQALLPGASLDFIDRCGHVPHREHPETTARVLSPFLARLESAGVAALAG